MRANVRGTIVLPAVLLAALATGSCQDGGSGGGSDFGPKTGVGAALGAAGGGLLGAAAGGGATGSVLDDQDRRTAANTTQQALESKPSGTTSTWTNPDTGHSGSVTPIRTYQASNGQYCREYEQSMT